MHSPIKKYVIGRAPTCDIVLADESVSRVHAELSLLANGKWLVTDCQSTQGTVLLPAGGGQTAVRQAWVSAQDTLRFGTVVLPVRELLQAIHLKHTPTVAGAGSHLPPEGTALVRCACGAVKLKDQQCEVCGA